MKEVDHNYNLYPKGFTQDELEEEIIKYNYLDVFILSTHNYHYIVYKQKEQYYFVSKDETYLLKDFITFFGIYRYIEFDNSLLFIQ